MSRSQVIDRRIKHLRSKQIPYEIDIKGVKFLIDDADVYPPGDLTKMFVDYLIEEKIIEDKVVADLGCGCFAVGIIAAMNGAKMAIGIDINAKAIKCAQNTIEIIEKKSNGFVNRAIVTRGEIRELSKTYAKRVDVILSGPPWDSITEKVDTDSLERAFYDVDDRLLRGVLCEARNLLKDEEKGKSYITSSARVINRMDRLCAMYKMQFKIIKEDFELEKGNPHYILEVFREGIIS